MKDFINYICDWVEHSYRLNGDDSFIYEIPDDNITYLISDKGIEKRLQKQLTKRLDMESSVEYKLTFPEYQFPRGEINIRLIKNRWYSEVILEQLHPYENIKLEIIDNNRIR